MSSYPELVQPESQPFENDQPTRPARETGISFSPASENETAPAPQGSSIDFGPE